MDPIRIYLAVPYTHPHGRVRIDRFEAVSRAAARLMLDGKIVYSPITHGHALCSFGQLPGDYKFWEEHCLSFLRNWAQGVYVLALPGWDGSRGVQAEIAEAERLGLPVVLISQEQCHG